MSAEWLRAARTRWKSTRRAGRPLLVRTAFIDWKRDASEGVRPRACAAVAGTRTARTARKATNTRFLEGSGGVRVAPFVTSGGGKPSAGGQGERDAGESNRYSGQLHGVERFPQPGPRDEGGQHRLEHGGDPGASCADPLESADDEGEGDDRAENDHPEHE